MIRRAGRVVPSGVTDAGVRIPIPNDEAGRDPKSKASLAADRRAVTKFRNVLLDQGFEMARFSAYLRFAEREEAAETDVRRVRSALPKKGKVHIVTITDRRYPTAGISSGANREQRGQKSRPARSFLNLAMPILLH